MSKLTDIIDRLEGGINDVFDCPGGHRLDSFDKQIAVKQVQKLMLETLRDTITESSDVAEIGEIFARKVGEL